MKEQLAERLKMLQAEHDAGQKMLAELDARRTSLTSTLLRIEGAIQVLKEMSDDGERIGPNGSSRGPGEGPR